MSHSPLHATNAVLFIVLFCLPLFTETSGGGFYTLVAIKGLIMALAAVGLNFIVGHAGLVSFGHAAFIGVGAYCVGIPIFHVYEDGLTWLGNGWIHLLLTLLISGALAAAMGAISLKTRGIYFIMITLAFAQLLYFFSAGIELYGGDDGLSLYQRSEFTNFLNVEDNLTLYYVCLISIFLVLGLQWRWLDSRFGKLIQGARINESRMRAIGYSPGPYQQLLFIVSGMVCGYAGFLMANFNQFISPDLLHWQHSGELLAIIILGGTRSVVGPLYGAVLFYSLEEFLSSINFNVRGHKLGEYWQLIFGPLLVFVVLYRSNGIYGLFVQAFSSSRKATTPPETLSTAPSTTHTTTMATTKKNLKKNRSTDS